MEGDDGTDERGEVDHEQAVVRLHCERLDFINMEEGRGGGEEGRRAENKRRKERHR